MTLDDLAQHFGYNAPYLSRIIKQNSGYTFKQLQMKWRMQHAQALMNETQLSVNDIMRIVGMNNPTYFYKKFAAEFGMSISQYRASK